MQQNNSSSDPYAALGIAGQMGCLMLVIAVGALGVGILLDRVLNTGHILTLACVVISIPVNLGFTLFITQRLIKRVIPPDTLKSGKKIDPGDEES